MDLQFYGANCLSVSHKGTRLVIDDNLDQLGAKGVTRPTTWRSPPCTPRPRQAAG